MGQRSRAFHIICVGGRNEMEGGSRSGKTLCLNHEKGNNNHHHKDDCKP